MKTNHIKTPNRSSKKSPCILAASATWLLPALVLILMIESSQADSATWVGSTDAGGDWNTPDNWTPATVPNGLGDTATFDTSLTTTVGFSADTVVHGIVFNPGIESPGSAFTIGGSMTSAPTSLIISDGGITNISGTTQNFVTFGGSFSFTLLFRDNATSGNNVTITNNGADIFGELGGSTRFYDGSTAGNLARSIASS